MANGTTATPKIDAENLACNLSFQLLSHMRHLSSMKINFLSIFISNISLFLSDSLSSELFYFEQNTETKRLKQVKE